MPMSPPTTDTSLVCLGTLAGEWTAGNMLDESNLEYLPANRHRTPRSSCSVRDPVERYWSDVHFGVWWAERAGLKPRPDVWLRRGIDTPGLESLARVFEREQVLILQYERCLAETGSQLRRTYGFVGLDASFVPESVEELVSQGSGEPKPPMSAPTREYHDGLRPAARRATEGRMARDRRGLVAELQGSGVKNLGRALHVQRRADIGRGPAQQHRRGVRLPRRGHRQRRQFHRHQREDRRSVRWRRTVPCRHRSDATDGSASPSTSSARRLAVHGRRHRAVRPGRYVLAATPLSRSSKSGW